LKVTGKNGSMPFPLPSGLSKNFCINPLIKITIQSKAPFAKALYCMAVPSTAFERQTVPHIKKRTNQWLYLPYNFSAGSKKCISTKKKIGSAKW
jgi:hypothetical protein